MANEKKPYLDAKIEIALVTAQDIVTSLTADSFDYVDQNGWDV